jgi:hypothetical protein
VMQEALFYGFSLERHVPDNHLLRKIDRSRTLQSRNRCEMRSKGAVTGTWLWPNESQKGSARVQATVAARQFWNASPLRARSVLRETRWR